MNEQLWTLATVTSFHREIKEETTDFEQTSLSIPPPTSPTSPPDSQIDATDDYVDAHNKLINDAVLTRRPLLTLFQTLPCATSSFCDKKFLKIPLQLQASLHTKQKQIFRSSFKRFRRNPENGSKSPMMEPC